MADVLFARPRWQYDSYSDVYRLIALSGYPLVFYDEIDAASDNTYILTVANGETEKGWPDARARLILWDLEWHVDGAPIIPGVSEVWASDAWYAQRIGARYVPMGSHEGLAAGETNGAVHYDFAMMSYYTYRRQWIRDRLLERGLTLAPNAWGDARHAALSGARAMLHVHQHDNINTVAPGRFALAAAYRLPVISERLDDWGIFNHGCLLCCDYPNLIVFADMWLRRNEARVLADYGRALHNLLCRDHTFRTGVEAAL